MTSAADVTEDNAKSPVQVVTRMMRLLDTLAASTQGVHLKQLASQTGLHPSTAHRILSALAQHRLVERTEPGVYQLGARLHELGELTGARRSSGPPPVAGAPSSPSL